MTNSKSNNTNESVFEKLKSDHRKVDKLFKSILATKEDKKSSERQELFKEIDSLLSAHAKAEEELFYPKTEENEKTKDLTLEAYEEHHLVKIILAEIEELDPSDPVWMAKVKVLSEVVKHHVKEEEEELFPKAKKIILKEESKEMAEEVEEVEMEEMQKLKTA